MRGIILLYAITCAGISVSRQALADDIKKGEPRQQSDTSPDLDELRAQAKQLRKIGNFAGVLSVYTEISKIIEAKHGANSLETIKANINEMSLLQDLGQFTQAETRATEILTKAQQLEVIPPWLIRETSLAKCNAATSRREFNYAAQHYQRVLIEVVTICGPTHIETWNARLNLANLHFKAKDYLFCKLWCLPVLHHEIEQNGIDSIASITPLRLLAYSEYELKDYGNATIHLLELVKLCRRYCGDTNIETLDALSKYANSVTETQGEQSGVSIHNEVDPKYWTVL